MSHPAQEAYDLSDAGTRDLIALIQQGKPLPDRYRFTQKVIDIFVNDTMTLGPVNAG